MTPEGSFALSLLGRPGLIRRAGMAGATAGLEWSTALALAAPPLAAGQFDADMLDACLTAADQGLAAGARRAESEG